MKKGDFGRNKDISSIKDTYPTGNFSIIDMRWII
jgi:hypothetical protein